MAAKIGPHKLILVMHQLFHYRTIKWTLDLYELIIIQSNLEYHQCFLGDFSYLGNHMEDQILLLAQGVQAIDNTIKASLGKCLHYYISVNAILSVGTITV